MIGCAEFCGYYDWTFEYLRRRFGEEAVSDYWRTAISEDSQRHARELIVGQGIAGMEEYWAQTLEEEEAGYHMHKGENFFRIDMFACPSLGLLLDRGRPAYHDYCDHCMGWIEPMIEEAGFVIHHEHNHAGQCYWEMRPANDDQGLSGPGEIAGEQDVRALPHWPQVCHHLWLASRRVQKQ